MKFSICIPQYNRIEYLVKSLSIIEQQSYENLEIVISDDCSTDNTVGIIKDIAVRYKFTIVFSSNETNKGYDYNLRKCIEMSSGEYVMVLGNDDTLNGTDSIAFLVDFLRQNHYPDLGFCNMIEERTGNTLMKRASKSGVIGTGPDIALHYYSSFIFVGGLIFKKSTFLEFNTSKFDGSVFVQLYLAVSMMARDKTLFSIYKPLVIKDILIDGKFRNSYRDRISKKWKDFKIVDGGLPSVIHVIISALRNNQQLTQKRLFFIFKRIYSYTYPHWILDYKSNNALPESVGLIVGLYPRRNINFKQLNLTNKIRLLSIFYSRTLMALIIPVFIFNKFKHKIYAFLKKRK